MTKIIFALRHAQSAGKQSGLRDYERLLTATGEAEARALGKKLMNQAFQIDLILASGADRVRQTVGLLNESLKIPDSKIDFRPELYEALMTDWQGIIHDLPSEYGKVLLAGHNPWLSMLISSFAAGMVDMAPCEFIGFEFNADSWKDLKYPGCKIMHIIPIKN